jgi:hypothetical protein
MNRSKGPIFRSISEREEPARPQLSKTQVTERIGALQLVFEPNLGQADPQVRFLTR